MARAVRSGGNVDTALLIACMTLALVVSVLPLDVREAIAGGLRRTVVAPLVSLQTQAEKGRSAFLAREATTLRVDSLSLRAMQLESMRSENDRLRSLLGLARQLQWGFVPAEALHPRVGDENTLTLTAGSNAGVKPYSPVIAPAGLVGMIRTVDPNTSTAITWSHPDFRVSAMAVDTALSAVGIVSAYLGGAVRGVDASSFMLEMRGVAFRASLRPGTLIVSSGLGGVYPRGIPIGTVLGEIKTSEGWTRTYLLRPVVFPPDVATIMILNPDRASGDVQSVWASAASADSAARRIAAAGDSLARLGAAAAAAARREMLDSAARSMQPIDPATGLPEATPVRPRADSTRRPPAVARPDTSRRAAPARVPTDLFRIDTTRPRTRRDSARRDTTRHEP